MAENSGGNPRGGDRPLPYNESVPGGPRRDVRFLLVLWLSALALLPACVSRTRVIARQGARPQQPLLEASKEDLLRRIAVYYETIRTLSLTVDMIPTLGSAKQGKLTEYRDVRGYLLYRRPAELRLIGLYPVFRAKAFDMATDGERRRLFVPSRNRFLEGRDVPAPPSRKKLENLRPHHFLQALVVRPPIPGEESPMLHSLTDEVRATYVLDLVGANASELRLRRQIWFDRLTLLVSRQLIFDEKGEILTDARYSGWRRENDVEFPRQIEIQRPPDEYGVLLRVTKLEINPPLRDSQFVLDRPEGVESYQLGGDAEGKAPQ